MFNKTRKLISKLLILVSALFSIINISCKQEVVQKADAAYLNEIEEWHTKRIKNLKKETGWLNLVGLYWLKEGENKFGSSSDNDVIFPKSAPKHIGSIFLKDSIVTTKILPDIKVLFNDLVVSEMLMQNDLTENPTILGLDSLKWLIIKRGNKYGVRLRDLDASLLKEFRGIDRFPVDTSWRIEAEFEAYHPPKKITVPNILGDTEVEMIPGQLIFNFANKRYTLDPIDSGSRLFIIFADETNGESTYGAGRFLYADKPDSTGKVILDFNKAYNPPCVFTKYATCPLPPAENRLQIKITAGEKSFGDNH